MIGDKFWRPCSFSERKFKPTRFRAFIFQRLCAENPPDKSKICPGDQRLLFSKPIAGARLFARVKAP